MAILDIYLYPHPVLRKKAERVEKFDSELHSFLDDMAETMFAADGVGLAAPQVGVSKRIFVLNGEIEEVISGGTSSKVYEMINPEIIEVDEDKIIFEEGCLSFPDIYGPVERFPRVKARYYDRFGEERFIEAAELLAIAIQHELDHLNGVLLIDKLNVFRQKKIKKLMKKRFGDTELHLQPSEIKKRLK